MLIKLHNFIFAFPKINNNSKFQNDIAVYIRSMLMTFFRAGITPEFAEKPEDVETLKS